jgi:hypothetical protein
MRLTLAGTVLGQLTVGELDYDVVGIFINGIG